MYRVEVFEIETEESYDIIVFDFEELEQLLAYIKNNLERFELIAVHQDYVCIGLDCFKECVEENEKE